MAMPLRTRVGGHLIHLLQGTPVEDVPTDAIPRLRQRRARAARLRGARSVMGHPHPAAPGRTVEMPSPPGAGLIARVYRPSTPELLPLLVYFHGGGFALGDAEQSEWLCSHLAAGARVAIVSVDYRLAPEHPFPTPMTDSYAAMCWIAEHAELYGADPTRLIVAGDSAGGNLAAVCALRARDEAGPSIAAQVLIYPVAELVAGFPSETTHANAFILTTAAIKRFSAVYLAGADGTHPHASPLRAADHSGLPAALVQTAEADPLRDNGQAYADALAVAGVPVRSTCYVGAVHGFLSLPGISPCAPQALAEIVAFVRTATGHAPSRGPAA